MPFAPAKATWVIGAGGLLGSALTTALRARAEGPVLTSVVPWTEPAAVRPALIQGLSRLQRIVEEQGCAWRVAWCAGAGVTGTSAAELDQEVATLTEFLADLADRGSRIGPGALFLSSSAGGVYAGSPAPPYTEQHAAVPISAYGHAKLAGEKVAEQFARQSGNVVVIGRMANLYGPGQNLSKSQGLISHLCRADLTRQPVSVYVSLDTVRDYLFVADCADMIADLLDRAGHQYASALTNNNSAHVPQPRSESVPGQIVVKILASQQGTTIGALVGECRRVFKRAPLLILGTSGNARFQVKDLRLRSVVWPEIDRRSLMPLPAGIAATAAGLLRATQTAGC